MNDLQETVRVTILEKHVKHVAGHIHSSAIPASSDDKIVEMYVEGGGFESAWG